MMMTHKSCSFELEVELDSCIWRKASEQQQQQQQQQQQHKPMMPMRTKIMANMMSLLVITRRDCQGKKKMKQGVISVESNFLSFLFPFF